MKRSSADREGARPRRRRRRSHDRVLPGAGRGRGRAPGGRGRGGRRRDRRQRGADCAGPLVRVGLAPRAGDARARRNTLVKLRLCQYSQRQLDTLAREEQIDYLDAHTGILYLYREARELELGAAKMQLLADHGQECRVLDAAEVVAVDPVFAPVEEKIAGAVYSPTDGSGNS